MKPTANKPTDTAKLDSAAGALKKNRDRLELALVSSGMATFDLDIIKNKRIWSDGVHKLLGTDPETFTGTAEEFFNIIHPEDRSTAQANLTRAIKTGIYETEYRAVWADGSVHNIAARGKVYYDAAGKAVQMTGVCWDVTEQKKAEEEREKLLTELNHRATELDTVFRALPYLVSVHDLGGTYLKVNPALVDLFGFDPTTATREKIAHNLKARFPSGQPLTAENMPSSRALKGESVSDVEYVITDKQGEDRTLLFNAIPLKSDEKIYGAIFAQTDITARKRAEEKLHKSEEKYRELVENANSCIIKMDSAGTITFFNDYAQNFFGYTLEEIIGQNVKIIVPETESGNGKDLSEMVRDLLGNPDDFSENINENIKKNGERVWISWRNKAIRDVHGKIIGNLAIGQDITKIRKAEEDLNRLNRTLNALNGVNHAILRAENEKQFLKEVCRIIIEDCSHKMAWIGFANNDSEKTVKPSAWSGFENGYLDTLGLTWADRERGQGPTGTAIRTGKPVICRDMTDDPKFKPWRQEALKRGYASSIALPLTVKEKTFGAIAIYSKEPNPFTDGELELLTQLAGDTAYGVYTLRLRKTHDQTSKKLRETKDYLDNLLNYANAPIIVWDPSFKITKFNTAFEQLSGLKSKNVIGKSLKILFPEKSKKESMEMIKSTLAGKRWEVVEIPIKRVDGEIRTVIWNSANILDDSGKVVATIAQGQDITAHKKEEIKRAAAETALKNRAQELEEAVRELNNLHLAVENASDMIFIADRGGTILSINKAVKNLLGRDPREVIGKKMRILGDALDKKQFDRMWEAINNDKKGSMAEISNQNKYGRKMIFELYISPILNDQNEVAFLIGVVRDRTEAKETDRAKTEFISLAAHQLRTPLSTISMASEMLERGNIGEIDETAKNQLREICDTAHKMADMIELFLNISRIELGRLEINPELLNPKDFARDLLREIAPQAATKKISIKTNLAARLPAVNIDRKVMHIVLENLLTNAVKYTPKGGRISFSALAKDGNLVISVADNGCGIPKYQIPLLFTKMFRAANVGEVKGLGLGLNMAKGMVEQCGGTISFQTEENKGSTFTVRIPLSGMKKKLIKMSD